MNDKSVLKQVAAMEKISDNYTDAWGSDAYVQDESIRHLLGALGYDTSSDEKLLEWAHKKHKQALLAPVMVVNANEQPVEVALHLPSTARECDFSWRLVMELGDELSGDLAARLVSDKRTKGGALVFDLPELPWGYHHLFIDCKQHKVPYESTLIITPTRCYKQPCLEKGEKLWGPSIQLYGLRSLYNWGIGDFGDLKQLVTEIASRGGDFIGLNPIHALFPANPEGASPYSPSSRCWLNIMYIDVSAVPEFALSAEAQKQVGSVEFQQRLTAVRKEDWVNYSEVARLKMHILPLLFNEFKTRHLDKETDRARTFLSFVKHGGESLVHQAAFDALHAYLHDQDPCVWGCPVFPKMYGSFARVAVQKFIRENELLVHSYMYFQWLADNQLNEAQQFAKECGMAVGLYRDLAVGVANSGAECWADTGNLIHDVRIGAPPDIFGPLGQNWGLLPFSPQALQATGYEAYIQLLRANMKHCGALRIDHVLGLLRLWWIPKDQGASDGAYVYYPIKEMLAILALESHRHKCAVIGEDLGTVPVEIVDALADAGIHSYKLFFFDVAQEARIFSPKSYKAQTMSALCTHDMPTLRGFWDCDDLRMGQTLGLYPDPTQLAKLYHGRLQCKQKTLDSLLAQGEIAKEVGHDACTVEMDSLLSEALQLHLAAGSSAFLSVQLEDWLAMDMPVNIPGTVDQYPNWRRKLSQDLDKLFAHEALDSFAKKLTQVRAQASHLAD